MDTTAIRLAVFITGLILFIFLETIFPKRKRLFSRLKRWPTNITITALNTLLLRLSPLLPISVAIYAKSNNIGLLNIITIPTAIKTIIALILLDLIIYIQHWAFHQTPILWKLHRMHHMEQDLDVTSALRFHPIEIILSSILKILAVLTLGISPLGILIFEIILNFMAMFNHANIKIPKLLDKILRTIIVTPDFHRIHHSTKGEESNSNYGFNLSLWDYIFKTHTKQPKLGQSKMRLGLLNFQEKTSIRDALLNPFK